MVSYLDPKFLAQTCKARTSVAQIMCGIRTEEHPMQKRGHEQWPGCQKDDISGICMQSGKAGGLGVGWEKEHR